VTREVAQPGSAPALGAGGREFESPLPDVRITHKVDYGVRVMTALADIDRATPGVPTTSATLAAQNGFPPGFLDDVLRLLRTASLVRSVRGGGGGWLLARHAGEITVADVIRAVDGPLATVRGVRPHELPDDGEREPFVSLWIAVRAALRSVLEHVTIADLASGSLPPDVQTLVGAEAWQSRDLAH
jgi:Rrf2 family protein